MSVPENEILSFPTGVVTSPSAAIVHHTASPALPSCSNPLALATPTPSYTVLRPTTVGYPPDYHPTTGAVSDAGASTYHATISAPTNHHTSSTGAPTYQHTSSTGALTYHHTSGFGAPTYHCATDALPFYPLSTGSASSPTYDKQSFPISGVNDFRPRDDLALCLYSTTTFPSSLVVSSSLVGSSSSSSYEVVSSALSSTAYSVTTPLFSTVSSQLVYEPFV